ncbi:MAG: AI-2E family transporter [Arthrobacter sp.]|nr:AI-2E family transporter [Arthrobacter sp.]
MDSAHSPAPDAPIGAHLESGAAASEGASAGPAPVTNPTGSSPSEGEQKSFLARLGHPFVTGFLLVLGGLLALLLGQSLERIGAVLVYVVMAAFLALGLEPLLRKLVARGLPRGRAVLVCLVSVVVLIAAVVLAVVPTVINQIAAFVQELPNIVRGFMASDTYAWVERTFDVNMDSALQALQSFLGNPANLAAIGGGALQVGTSIANALSSAVIILVITLYFVTGLHTIKASLIRLAPARSRERVSELTEKILLSSGAYVGGMVVLAAMNAVFVGLLCTVTGMPFALLMGVAAFGITLIPMVGSVLFWVIGTVAALFNSPLTALVFGLVYFVYIQVEAYLLTPKIMSKAVSVPGVVVIISAVAGGSLLGLLGAFIAIPIAAAILIVVKEVWIPRQDRKS